MKKILFCLSVFVLIFSCSTRDKKNIEIFSAPGWFSGISSDNYIIRGAGSGSTLKEARGNAFSDISSQIEVRVQDEISIVKKKSNENISSFMEQKISTISRNKISNAKRIKNEVFNNRFFVAYEVDMRPFYLVLAEKIRKRMEITGEKIPLNLRFRGSRAVTSSLTASMLKGSFQNYNGEGEKEIDLYLDRKQGGWYLVAGMDYVEIPEILMILDFDYLKKGDLKISILDRYGKSLPNRLKQGDYFRFVIESPENGGYLSLFNIYSDGRVSILFENIKKEGNSLIYPDAENSTSVFQAALLEDGKAVLDYYVVLNSECPLDLIKFKKITGNTLVSSEHSYAADKVLCLMENHNVKGISILKVETIPLKD